MYLKKLEIFGFKSFANKSTFTFAPGITAIVGPNGCGKTNVVDAIRWALGEQKTTVLRSEVMENVIFNGTGNRKPLGMAEVSLSLENNKMILPVEYSEVVVTRRLYRNGDSNYLLNKTQCRLKDITNLFLDTGMGADSYSVIELKMVEAILSGKAEERRRLIEEAAGINKYKIRRKEAVRKLAYVQTDLVRAQDIVLEIEKQVRSLKRSSAKTKRFNKLNLELLQLQKQLIAFDYINYNNQLTKLKSNLNELNADKTKLNQEILDSENYLKNLESNFHKIDEEFQAAQEKESRIKDEIAKLNKDFAVSEEKVKSNEENVNRYKIEIQNLIANREQLTESIASTEERIVEKQKDADALSKELETHNKILAELDTSVNDARNQLNSKNEEIINKRNKIESISTYHSKSEGRKQFLLTKIDESEKEVAELQKEIAKLQEEIDKNQKETEKLKGTLAKQNELISEYTDKRNEITKLIEEKKKELADLRVVIAKKNSEFEFLSNIELRDDAANKLLKHKKWITKNPKSLLIELINIREEYKPAIESALGQYANVFVVDEEKEALDAIGILEKEKLGKAGFISRDKIPDIKKEFNLPKLEGAIGFISELADVDDKIRNILRIISPDYVLVNDLETGKNLLVGSPEYKCITLKGEIISANGFIRGGSVSKREGIFVGKSKRLNEIQKETKKLMSKMQDEENNLNNLQNELSEYNLETLQNKIKALENDIFYSEQNQSQFNYKIDTLKNKIDNIHQNIANFRDEISDIGNEKSESTSELETLQKEIEINKKELIEINKKLTEIHNKFTEKSEFVKDIELDLIKIKTELKNEEREKIRLEDEIVNNKQKTNTLEQEIKKALNEIDNLKSNKGNLDSEIAKLISISEEAQTKREFLQQEKQSLEEQINQHEEELSRQRKTQENLIENIHKIDLQLSEINLKLESVLEQNDMLENEKIDFANASLSEDFDPENTKAAVQELRNKLSALGNINFMALEEYEAEKERMDFYHKQMKDLSDSEKTLQETIKEINETAEDLFMKTFNLVNENFTKLFKKLFSDEADASLSLTSDNLLECDIEITAKPPGKKPHSIDLLSGGEKTLTSIAFLFSIYLVKPSPFCILDEVDAPLDDTNIDKFLDMIREFSKDIQFLIVTHNKKSMEVADTMYGITQQEEGVSKIVSVKLKEEVN